MLNGGAGEVAMVVLVFFGYPISLFLLGMLFGVLLVRKPNTSAQVAVHPHKGTDRDVIVEEDLSVRSLRVHGRDDVD